MLKIFQQTLYYELLFFCRERAAIFHPLGFFLLVVFIFTVALSPQPNLLNKLTPGILWVATLLACLLALENFLRSDLNDQALEQLILSPHPLAWLISAKLSAFWLATVIPLLLSLPLLGLLLPLSGQEVFMLSLSLLLGTPGLILIGATCKTLALSLQQQGVLLGLLVLPLSMPILFMGVSTLPQLSLGIAVSGNLAFLAGVSLFCLCTLPWAMAAALRWGMEI